MFILYELSTPFLDFHWFFDKLGMTGSVAQLVNGIMLISTFGACRLVWGVYQSVRIYKDMWMAIQALELSTGDILGEDGVAETAKAAAEGESLPVVLTGLYLASNTLLIALNAYWFRKMIEALMKRFSNPEKKKE